MRANLQRMQEKRIEIDGERSEKARERRRENETARYLPADMEEASAPAEQRREKYCSTSPLPEQHNKTNSRNDKKTQSDARI